MTAMKAYVLDLLMLAELRELIVTHSMTSMFKVPSLRLIIVERIHCFLSHAYPRVSTHESTWILSPRLMIRANRFEL